MSRAAPDWEKVASEDVSQHIISTTNRVRDLLLEKNKSYGNSALNPPRIFAKGADAELQLMARIDDKIARVQNGHEFPGDDTILDLCGYLILVMANRRMRSNMKPSTPAQVMKDVPSGHVSARRRNCSPSCRNPKVEH